jgi:hypothetical protein
LNADLKYPVDICYNENNGHMQCLDGLHRLCKLILTQNIQDNDLVKVYKFTKDEIVGEFRNFLSSYNIYEDLNIIDNYEQFLPKTFDFINNLEFSKLKRFKLHLDNKEIPPKSSIITINDLYESDSLHISLIESNNIDEAIVYTQVYAESKPIGKSVRTIEVLKSDKKLLNILKKHNFRYLKSDTNKIIMINDS